MEAHTHTLLLQCFSLGCGGDEMLAKFHTSLVPAAHCVLKRRCSFQLDTCPYHHKIYQVRYVIAFVISFLYDTAIYYILHGYCAWELRCSFRYTQQQQRVLGFGALFFLFCHSSPWSLKVFICHLVEYTCSAPHVTVYIIVTVGNLCRSLVFSEMFQHR